MSPPAPCRIFSDHAASLWEVVMKIALALDRMPLHHRDPFDRIFLV